MISALFGKGGKAASETAPRSVYFFTLHKCASSLFADFVLKNCPGLEHVDYAARIYGGETAVEPSFVERGAIYGPLRLSVSRNSPIFEQVVAPTMARRFIRDKRALVLIRDPRDIVVSCYYSFGFSHGSSDNCEIRAQQDAIKERIQSEEGIDEFVLRSVAAISRHFQRVEKVVSACREGELLRYEDLIEDFETFAAKLGKVLDLKPEILHELHDRSRPRESEDIEKHHRSGRTGGFREKLRPETVESLNRSFAPILESFGYSP